MLTLFFFALFIGAGLAVKYELPNLILQSGYYYAWFEIIISGLVSLFCLLSLYTVCKTKDYSGYPYTAGSLSNDIKELQEKREATIRNAWILLSMCLVKGFMGSLAGYLIYTSAPRGVKNWSEFEIINCIFAVILIVLSRFIKFTFKKSGIKFNL